MHRNGLVLLNYLLVTSNIMLSLSLFNQRQQVVWLVNETIIDTPPANQNRCKDWVGVWKQYYLIGCSNKKGLHVANHKYCNLLRQMDRILFIILDDLQDNMLTFCLHPDPSIILYLFNKYVSQTFKDFEQRAFLKKSKFDY